MCIELDGEIEREHLRETESESILYLERYACSCHMYHWVLDASKGNRRLDEKSKFFGK
jgi:hypothetical protein